MLAAAYVASLRGQNLPSDREAEGNVIPPWPESPMKQAMDEPTEEGESDSAETVTSSP